MAIRDKFQANAQPYLEPGEQIQAVFGSQKMSQWWVALTIFILLFGQQYYVVVVTDRRILVGRSGRVTTTKITAIERVLPRATRIGPCQGIWYRTDALGETMRIHKRFHKDVDIADAFLGAAPPPPA